MLNVRVLSSGVLIGNAELFASDPPMGVATGTLRVTSEYDRIRSCVDALCRSKRPNWDSLELEVVTEEGIYLHAVGGITVADIVEEDYDEPPEISICGINCASGQYEEWFGTDPAYKSYYGL